MEKFWIKETETNFDLVAKDGEHVEPSAIEPINERFFLVADDQSANLHVVKNTGKIMRDIKLGDFKKPKWEAMAHDGEYFYIVGSHSVKLDDPDKEKLTRKLAQRSRLLRFKLQNTKGKASEIEVSETVEMNVSEAFKAAGFYNEDPFKNKLKIEGLAARREADGKTRLVFALREPHDVMHIYSAVLPDAPQNGDRLAPEPFFTFDAGSIGTIPFRLSSLEYAACWKGFFIMTSTEEAETNAFSGNALWFVSDEAIEESAPKNHLTARILRLFAADMKAEGLCVLPGATGKKLRLAKVFDNDYKDTGKPGKMQVIEVSRN